MAPENVSPKRSPVKSAENPPAPAVTRPPLKFIEDTLGYKLEAATFIGGLLGLYEGGYFDDENGQPLSPADIRIRAEGYHKSAALEAARLKREQIKKAKEQFAAAQTVVTTIGSSTIISSAQEANPAAAITCTRCKEQFEFLRNQPYKMCGKCQWLDVEERQAAWDAEQQAKKYAAAADLAASRADWTKAQWDEHRREARKFMEGTALRRAHRWLWLTDHVKLARELRDRLYGNPAAKDRCKRLGDYADRWEERAERWRKGYHDACERYWQILKDDCSRRDIHPKYRYCHNDGLPIPWDRNSFYCDDACKKAADARGEEHVDTGTFCHCGACLITDDQPLIDALPCDDIGTVFHTHECLMSAPDIDEDDFKDFGPDAACWKPLLHVALVKPAHTFKERQKQIMSSPEKVLAMTGGPTARMILENPEQARALLARWMPNALPAAPTKALGARKVLALGPSEGDRVLDFVTSAVKDADGYVSLMQVRRGPARIGERWISNTAARAALDRLTADQRLVKHPTENKWRLA